jgi:NitT/TauT family transport system ATP-binding protein
VSGPAADFVRLEKVALVYGQGEAATHAVEDMTLSVGRGECIAVVGPSGCGKSSAMKLVSGLMRATAGTVMVDGRRVDRPLKNVGMAFQNPVMLPWRSTRDNVLLPIEIVDGHRQALARDRRPYLDRVEQLLATVGLAGFGDKYPWQLSGGMQQRASICRALVHEPEILLLDEPFAALDAFTREELWGVLQDIWLQRGFTVILVTHDLREAVYLADTVYVMSKRPGRIVARVPIPVARPRTVEGSFAPEFVDLVHHLRGLIGEVRAS